MKKLPLIGLTVLSFFVDSSVNATEVVCVDGNELIKDSQYAQQLKQEIEVKKQQIIAKYRQEAQKLIEQLQKLQKELSSGLLSPEAKKQKQEEYIKLQQKLQFLQIQAQQEVQKYIFQQLRKLDKLTKAALKVLVKVKGFDMVADCNNLLYYSANVDITKDVARVIDQMVQKNKEGEE